VNSDQYHITTVGTLTGLTSSGIVRITSTLPLEGTGVSSGALRVEGSIWCGKMIQAMQTIYIGTDPVATQPWAHANFSTKTYVDSTFHTKTYTNSTFQPKLTTSTDLTVRKIVSQSTEVLNPNIEDLPNSTGGAFRCDGGGLFRGT